MGENITRDRTLDRWLSAERNDKDFNAALDFLRTNGRPEDIPAIQARLEALSTRRRSAAASTIVHILAKTDKEQAFEAAARLNPDQLEESSVHLLFHPRSSVSTSAAARCLNLKSERLRRSSAHLLLSRNAITQEMAETLLADPDVEIRFVGATVMRSLGTPLHDDVLKKALKTPTQGEALPSSLLNAEFRSEDHFYDQYNLAALASMSYTDLKAKASQSGVFNFTPLDALYRTYTRQSLRDIRFNLDDRFESYISSRAARTESVFGIKLADGGRIFSVIRTSLISISLEAICANSDRTDLERVRRAVDEEEFFSTAALRYIARHGDWTDINRITTCAARYQIGPHQSWPTLDERWLEVASALYAIGKERIADLLDIDLPVDIQRMLIAQFSSKYFREMTTEMLIALLKTENDQIRRITALKCVSFLNRSTLSALLKKYADRPGRRYYNVIHWLDLGVSMPRPIVKAVCQFELSRSW